MQSDQPYDMHMCQSHHMHHMSPSSDCISHFGCVYKHTQKQCVDLCGPGQKKYLQVLATELSQHNYIAFSVHLTKSEEWSPGWYPTDAVERPISATYLVSQASWSDNSGCLYYFVTGSC